MPNVMPSRGLSRGVVWSAVGGVLALLSAWGGGPRELAAVGVALLGYAGWRLYSAARAAREPDPWPWPPDLRAAAERMALPIDPTPKRILPPDEKTATVAAVATTADGLARLIADRPPAWSWALFASVLLQRRNAVGDRLRRCVSGYQPRGLAEPLSGRLYAQVARGAMTRIVDVVGQMEQFMLSPGFTGTLGRPGEASHPDPGAIISVANRLMDYHEELLAQAEISVQTAVQPEARVYVQDMGALTLCPLVGYDQFIYDLCARIGEAQDLLPYTNAGEVVALDDANLAITLPDGLSERLAAHARRFAGA